MMALKSAQRTFSTGLPLWNVLARDGVLQTKALLHLLGLDITWKWWWSGFLIMTLTLFKVDEYGHVEGDTPAEQEVVFMNNLNIVASAPHRQCNTNMSGCHDDWNRCTRADILWYIFHSLAKNAPFLAIKFVNRCGGHWRAGRLHWRHLWGQD